MSLFKLRLLSPCLLLSTAFAVEPVARRAAPAPSGNAQLPVTRVALYKNGVGFFEHTGRVTGNQSVTIDFTSSQLNDVLQSLTAIDLNGGRIAGAGYNSTTPLEEQLKALPLALGETPTSIDFYNAIRGARVEAHSGNATLLGRVLSFEVRTAAGITESAPATEKHFLTVASDAGAVRTFELTPGTEVRLLDTPLRLDLTRYLELIASTRNQGLRHLTLQDNGTGTRDLRVSYISEVPVWKSTYRILFTMPNKSSSAPATQTATLQGWSVVDNTTGADWTNVQLSLIAGAPQSFIQPLSIPYYNRRQEIGLPKEAQLSPQTHESGDVNGPPTPQVAGVAGMSGLGPGAGGSYGGSMGGTISRSGTNIAQGKAMAGLIKGSQGEFGAASQSVTVDAAAAPMIAYEEAAGGSVVPQTTTAAFDDYFEYKLTEPVTIRKNESALVPILQATIDAERVTLWSPSHPMPLRALWITNTSSLTLDRGSFSIVEDGNFGGEGLLDPIHPNERRLLSYAADQAVRVSTDYVHNTRRVQQITVSKGVLKQTSAEVSEVEYLVRNAAPEPRTVIVEHPVRQGWVLDSEVKPAETTPTTYRFRVATKANETVRLHIGERHRLTTTYQLGRSDDNQLQYLLNETGNDPKLAQAIEPILAARRKVADAQAAVNDLNQRLTALHADEERQRANITALKDADKSSRQRFVDELNRSEDQIAQQQKELAARSAELQTAQQDLANRIETIQIDETLSQP